MEANQVNRNINQYIKGQVIFEAHTKASQIALLVKGRVVVESVGMKEILYSGSFLGVQDVFAGDYLCTYRALDDTILCLFDTTNVEQLYENIISNPDYCGLVVASLCKQLGNLYNIYENLYNCGVNSYRQCNEYNEKFKELVYNIKLERESITKVSGLEQPKQPILDEMINYYRELDSFALETIRSFFSQGNVIVKYHMKNIASLYRTLLEINQKLVSYVSVILNTYISTSQESIFYKYAELALTTQKRGKNANEVIKILDQVIESINEVEKVVEDSSNQKPNVNRANMEETYFKILSGSTEDISYEGSVEGISEDEIKMQLSGSMDIILTYSQIEFEKSAEFKKDVMAFAQMKDKLAIDDDARALRRKIADQFYGIYERVFIKAIKDANQPLAVQLFLKFGFVDEHLLKEEQIIELYRTSLVHEGGKFKVYTIYEWLKLVYEGKREPSKNEFDQDYTEYLRAELVAKRITQEEYTEKSKNQFLKLHYEIFNFFRYVNRIASGKITSFIPILHADSFGGSIERLIVGAHKIESTVQRIMDIDFSLFYREIGYVNKELNIEKEYIMQEVLPEFILVPTCGANGTMWQTISGKQRNTPARFVLPQFMEGNLSDIILKMCAKYRWEMCRTIQGSTWNNIKYKSLTSEYVDYIQFYRKNHELSEERKEKIKAQIQKCSNRMADIFTIDYEAWIKGESQGAVRLNKVARRILAMYCPFEKNLRVKISPQPLFMEALQGYELERQKKAREISNHYKSLQNNHIELPKELLDSLAFYQDL